MIPRLLFLLVFGPAALCQVSLAAIAPVPTPPRNVPVAEPPTPITTVAGAFARWPELKTDEGPVRLEGVVTGTMPNGAFRLHDGELGIYVSRSTMGQALTPGDRVVVSGFLRKGGFSPWIAPVEVVTTGRGEFPKAQPASYNVLASGTVDNQWVEIEGVVRAVQVPTERGLVVLDFGMLGGTLRVLVNSDNPDDFNSLIDAEVVVRGVAAVNHNAQKQVVEPSFRVPSRAEIIVRRPGQPDPFVQPRLPLSSLMRFSLGASYLRRVRTGGVVTRRLSDTVLFVRDGPNSVKVETRVPTSLKSGDLIEVAGFPVMVEGMAVLQQAICRAVGVSTSPPPVEPTLVSLLDGTHNSDLVRIKARLVDWVIAGQNSTLVFQTGDQFFKALYTLPPTGTRSLPDKNSLVNVTGICVINELEDVWFYQPRSFLLLVAEPDDLEVLQAPPWWTPERLWRALIITGVVLLAAGGWVWALRRQIGRKRAVIEQQARHAAALEERSRIARELHDTLEQGLTGLSLQMKAMETDLNGTPHPVQSRLQFARQMLRQSRALARNAIREMRTETVPSRFEGLIDGIKRVANTWNHSGALAVAVEITGDPRPLPAPLEPHLLGIGTEAMTNSVKHGRASAIRVEIAYRATEVVLRIKDDGAGFDPVLQLEQSSGCFGLLGMRERAREIRGDLRILSQPGAGTEVIVSVPLAPAAATVAPAVPAAKAPPSLTVRAPAA
jgi:signal transduction histidine kinase